MDSISPDEATTAGGRLARGRARMREIAVEDAAKRQRLVAELLAELGWPAGAVDRVTAYWLQPSSVLRSAAADARRASGPSKRSSRTGRLTPDSRPQFWCCHACEYAARASSNVAAMPERCSPGLVPG